MADLKQHLDDISTAAKEIPHFDPNGTVRKEIEGANADKPNSKVETAPSAVNTPPPPAVASPAGESPVERAENPVQGAEEERGGSHDKAEGRLS